MQKLPVIGCVLFFFAAEVIAALKEGDPGVCVTKISSRRTKKITFTRYTNKWCGPRKCIARSYKTQGYTVSSKHTICCSGFEYNEEGEYCAPHCSMKCAGTCVAPETCHCEPPTYLHPEYNTCVQPSCDPPCVNSQCVANNKCQCNDNYQVYNASLCVPMCQTGYALDEKLSCTPKCQPTCINGHCTAPNVCTCFEGYILKNGICEPNCDDCVNGKCIAPNSCTCLEGYSAVNNTHCTPKCHKCINGECTAPNTCNCAEGLILSDGVCVPKCDDCINGNCIAPNTCACLEGYSPVNDTYCAPRCTNCVNGTCRTPDICTCSEGYYLEEGECVPQCDNCVNGHCDMPNICRCSEGHDLIEGVCILKCGVGFTYNDGSCKAVCEVPCVNGYCVEPNVCACNEGYQKNETSPGNCYRPCDGPCEGTCTEHGECVCYASTE